jgi:predicted TIM-barrel fold metal-dependent hydrolase
MKSPRRDFIKKTTAGIIGAAVSATRPLDGSASTPSALKRSEEENWQNNPEWRKVKYGDWGGPGVNANPGPMDKILLKDHAPRSLVVNQQTFVPKAKHPVIDTHIHTVARTGKEIDEWIRTMDEVGVETSVVLTGAIGEQFDSWVKKLMKAYPGRFQICCGLDRTNIDSPDYSKRMVTELIRCYENGACGVGEISDKGYGITRDRSLPRNKRLHPDDDRLDAFWDKCAELNIPVILHVADHPSCWTPLDVYQERTPDYQHFNQYGADIPTHAELIARRDRTLEKHPGTIFIACHLGNQGHDLAALSKSMDKYPNLYLDTSARDYELGRTPRAAARFIEKYRNRILFGTDQGRQKSMYQIHWRLFETDDEYIVGRVGWRLYGLDLSSSLLKSLYCDNAKTIVKFR